MATLVAFACTLEANAQDDALDVLDRLLTDLLARVDKQERQRRLRTIGDLDAAALLLRDISLVVLDRATSDHTVRHEILARVSRERIEQAIATVGRTGSTSGERAGTRNTAHPLQYSQAVPAVTAGNDRSTRHYWRQGRAGREFLHRLERTASAPMHEAPLRIVTPAWWRLVVRPNKTIDRRAYTFCALQATHAADADDLERLSPLVHHHIHLDGRYSFTLPEPLTHGELRPLRDPNDPAEQVFELTAASA